MKHLTRIIDLTTEEIKTILDLADRLKEEYRAGKETPYLKGKTLGMIFQKSSTRTRVSFETGIYQLGGMGLFLSTADIQMGRGEPIKDTARVLSRYLDAIMIRTFAQTDIDELVAYGTIPIINGLTDDSHPCQILADLMTIREYKGKTEGVKLAYVGDGNNVANSLMVGCLKMGMDVSLAIPRDYPPHPEALAFAREFSNFTLVEDPREACRDADVIYTDVYASMGKEKEQEKRLQDFQGYQVNRELLEVAKPDCILQHCLPAHRGEEISEEAFEAHADEIFDQAENRMHVQKAVMVLLMGGIK